MPPPPDVADVADLTADAPPPAAWLHEERVEGEFDPPATVIARVVGLFAAVGLGLATLVTIFLWLNGFFDIKTDANDFSGAFSAIFGGIALLASLVIGLTLAMVLAAMGGIIVAGSVSTRRQAVAIGALANALGYLALTIVLGGLMIAVLNVAIGGFDRPESATPTLPPQFLQECLAANPTNPDVCNNFASPSQDAESEGPDTPEVAFTELVEMAPGAIPAAIVGALVAALMYTKPRRPSL